MQRVNGHPVFYLGWTVGVLVDHLNRAESTYATVAPVALQVAQHLETLASAATIISLPLSQPHAASLAASIRAAFSEANLKERANEGLSANEKASFAGGIYKLDNLLAAELAECQLYFVSQKRAWNMSQLIFNAETFLSKSIASNLTEDCQTEIREAGRCIAFDLPTASGFHVFRALEALILRYFPMLGVDIPKDRNWGNYIRVLEEKKVDEKIIGMLRHLKDFYRNPLVHPEITLDLDEAENLFQFGGSAISVMVDDLRKRTLNPAGLLEA